VNSINGLPFPSNPASLGSFLMADEVLGRCNGFVDPFGSLDDCISDESPGFFDAG